MPAKPSGEVKVSTIRQPQKNGDIYILERKTIYDPQKKYNRILSTKLISKIPKGSETPVSTRAKRAKGSISADKSEIQKASRKHVGMMDIINHIGTVSGIDDAVYASADPGTAQKIISLARYLLATNGQSLPGILTWQFNHPIPYEHGITEDICHNLFVQIGLDEKLQQNFFLYRCKDLDADDALAYDSSTLSTYSQNQIEARYGFNKAKDGLKTIKFLALYSIKNRQPVAFTKQPGNIPDVISISNALNQLSVLGLRSMEIITDNGYYSEKNFSLMMQAGFDFITLAKTSIRWIKPEVDKHREDLDSIKSACPFDPHIHGITVLTKQVFEKERKYANHKSGANKGDIETFERRIYIHIYYNAANYASDKNDFESELCDIKNLIESGTPVDELSESAQKKVSKYFKLRTRGSKTTVIPNDKAIKDASKYHGFFVLVSNNEKDAFEALRKYRRRETIESFFEAEKQHADGTRVRVWNADTLRGRMFVQFVALCYYEYFSEQIRQIKTTLDAQLLEMRDNAPQNDIKLVRKLKTWVANTPLYLQLQWFDTVEEVQISTQLKNKRWSTEMTQQDILYLKHLGMPSD